MIRTQLVSALAIVAAIALMACGDSEGNSNEVSAPMQNSTVTPSPSVYAEPKHTPPTRASTATPAEIDSVIAGNNQLAIDLLRAGSPDASQNACFSPWGISNALAMTWAGARGQTEATMRESLHFTLPQSRLHDAISGANQKIESGAKSSFWRISNRIWGDRSIIFQPEFVANAKDFYGAAPEMVDFAGNPDRVKARINDVIAKDTAGRIRDILGPSVVTRETQLLLTNAVYFKGAWLQEFDPDATRPRDFHLTSGEVVRVPMMRQMGRFGYFEAQGAQAVGLDYVGAQFSMVLILPEVGKTLEELERSLTPDLLGMIMAATATSYEVDVTIPKFTIENRLDLKRVLTSLGMGTAFTDSADFSGASGTMPLKISDVAHQAFIEVNEVGTEAAAGTAISEAEGSVPLDEPKIERFTADRPFLFMIRDTNTETILFIGRVADPR